MSYASTPPTTAPVLTGTAWQGQVLGVNIAGIGDGDGLGAFSYQWLRDGAVIGGSSSSCYRLIKADAGAEISVRVSYAEGLGTRDTLVSAATSRGVLAAVTGGGGNDTLTGGAGADQFVFAAGDDLITDFNKGQKDRLLLSDDLWGGKMSARQVVQTFGEVAKVGVMLEFDSGDSVTIRGITSLNALVSQIDVI